MVLSILTILLSGAAIRASVHSVNLSNETSEKVAASEFGAETIYLALSF